MSKEYVKTTNPNVKIVKVDAPAVSDKKIYENKSPSISPQTITWSKAIKVKY